MVFKIKSCFWVLLLLFSYLSIHDVFANNDNSDSLYCLAVKKRDTNLLKKFMIDNKDNMFGAIAACRLIYYNLEKGKTLEAIVADVKYHNIDIILMRPYSNAHTVVFPKFNFRIVIFDNPFYNRETPKVEYYIGDHKFIEFGFDVLHLLAKKEHLEYITPNFQFIISDSSMLGRIKIIYRRSYPIIKDFCDKLGYNSIGKAFKKCINRNSLIKNKLVVFYFNIYELNERYSLNNSGRSYTQSGMIYLNSGEKKLHSNMNTFIHEISHVLLNGNRFDPTSRENRWFDEGFAQWAAHCYINFGKLFPPDSSFLLSEFKKYIKANQLIAYQIINNHSSKYISLKSINKAWSPENHLYGTIDSYLLSLSLISFIVDQYGGDKLIKIASYISHQGLKLTETFLRNVLKRDYKMIEQEWNRWVLAAYD